MNKLILTAVSLMFIAGCGGGVIAPPAEQSNELRIPQSGSYYDLVINGGAYNPEIMPPVNVTGIGDRAVYNPDGTVAYAMYLATPKQWINRYFGMVWNEAHTPDVGDIWVGLYNHDTDMWDWRHILEDEIVISNFKEYASEDGLSVLVMNYGGHEAILEYMQFYGRQPALTGYTVNGLPNTHCQDEMYSGADVEFAVIVSGTGPITTTWDFGGGTLPNQAEGATVNVILLTAGEYTMTIRSDNELGYQEHEYPYTVTP